MSFSAPLTAIGSDLAQGAGFGVSAGQSALGPFPPAGTSGAGLPSGKAYAIAAAASKYNVPINILVGVYGKETDFGRNVATSSAGAIGDFQFLPSTARSYNYPLTNTPTPAQFQQQADGAARYLSVLFKQTGSWDRALQSYSGSGYGLSQVTAKAKQAPSSLQGILNSTGFTSATAPGAIAGSAANAANWVPNVISDVFNQAVSDLKYAAVLVVVLFAAGYLVVHGLGGGTSGGKTRHVPVPV